MATEAVAEPIIEPVAETLEGAATAVRQLNLSTIGLVGGGLGVGLAIGFVIGWRFNRAKIRAEAFAESEEEVEKIREMYRDAVEVRMGDQDKPALEEVIEDRQYGMKVEIQDVTERLPNPPVVVSPPTSPSQALVNQPSEMHTHKSPNELWDQERELASRTPEHPYIIHEEEFSENFEDRRQETLTYYAEDGVLADEHEDRIEDIDGIVGSGNLEKFGHGSGDINVLFVRNEARNMEYEISRVPGSYAQLVLGLSDEHPE